VGGRESEGIGNFGGNEESDGGQASGVKKERQDGIKFGEESWVLDRKEFTLEKNFVYSEKRCPKVIRRDTSNLKSQGGVLAKTAAGV